MPFCRLGDVRSLKATVNGFLVQDNWVLPQRGKYRFVEKYIVFFLLFQVRT